MSDRAVARRYADGFLAFAKDTIGTKKGLEEIISFGEILNENPELSKFLENPEITCAEKSGFVDAAFKSILSIETRDFIKLIIEKRRSEEAVDIADEAKILYRREMGIEKAVIKSAKPLPQDIVRMIKDRLEGKFEKKLEFEIAIDPGLLGGVQATVGNIVIDGSVKRKLYELKEYLMESKVE
ncbi:MAG: ATP synthase F1 subunit delta [Candidatus Omnitrophica bacterium]|nr:ATP synthase F1 subunit delta [Candidatus Omnitrophota bacterium]MDD5310227.1 ATP synthase F1 subunit delta [Candidatus Omnitrophota bacterium]MDD5546195.1 ATP synthase F1 subunit delta [Candidatus Omnitrophota bacterium]